MNNGKNKIMDKITLNWSLLCSNTTLDSNTNNLSLFNVIEQINISVDEVAFKEHKEKKTEGFIVPFQGVLVSKFKKRRPSEAVLFDFVVDFINPEGKALSQHAQTLDFKSGIKNMRVRNDIPVLPVLVNGEYNFVLKIREVGDKDFVEIGKVPLDINIQLPIVKG